MSSAAQSAEPGIGTGQRPYEQYGASELKTAFQRYMTLGVALSAALNTFLILLALAALYVNQKLHERQETRVRIVPMQMLQPPPLSKQQTEQIKTPDKVAPPSVGIPVPVPDAQAPQEQTLASLDDIAKSAGGSNVGSGNDIVIAAQEEASVSSGTYVYRDDEPTLIRPVAPKYPDLARSSGIEGKVILNVLVGTTGKVEKVEVQQGVPVLNDAAIEAVKQYLFKPALANNKPVAVWVAVPILFKLSGN